MSILSAILALGFLVFVHELGHFLLAKLFRVHVLEFAVGFGPRIFGVRRGETAYSLRAIPLGGYVRMAGENPGDFEQTQTSAHSLSSSSRNEGEESGVPDLASESISPELATDRFIPQMTADRDRWFLSQKFWPKFLIVFAGPAFNVLFAILMAWFAFFIFGRPEYLMTSQIGEVMQGLPAHEAGLRSGDIVRFVNATSTETWDELSSAIREQGEKPLLLKVQRGEEQLEITLKPTLEQTEVDALFDESGERRYKIGIFPATERMSIGFFEAGLQGVRQVYYISELTLRGLSGMITGKVSANNIAGPLFIFKHGSEAAKTGVDRLIDFMVFLSVSLALLNLLPIPVLDGGHLLFFIIEAICGAPVNMKIQERATQVGMLALLALMVFAISNDIRRFLE